MEKKRDYRVSYIRAIATVSVVLLHIVQHFSYTYPKISIFSDWLNLGLVLFFVISAFLYSKRDINRGEYGKWIAHRYAEIAIPSVFTTVCAILVFFAFGIKVYGKRLIYCILCGLGFEAFVPDPWVFIQLWFLTYILICYITLPFIQKIEINKFTEKEFWGGVVAVSFIMQGALSTIHSPVSWGVLLRFYLPYAVFKRYDVSSQEIKKVIKAFGFLVIPCLLSTIALRYFISADGVLAKAAELSFIYTQTILGFILFYVLYQLFGHVNTKKVFIRITDRYSYPVYLTHCLFIGYNTSVIDVFENRLIGMAVALALTMISSSIVLVLTNPIIKRTNMLIKKHKNPQTH